MLNQIVDENTKILAVQEELLGEEEEEGGVGEVDNGCAEPGKLGRSEGCEIK